MTENFVTYFQCNKPGGTVKLRILNSRRFGLLRAHVTDSNYSLVLLLVRYSM